MAYDSPSQSHPPSETSPREASRRRKKLLDWSGRQLRPDKRGAIPSDLPPILERLGIRGESFLDLIEDSSTWFRVAAGRVEQLLNEARRLGRNFLHGRARCQQAFT